VGQVVAPETAGEAARSRVVVAPDGARTPLDRQAGETFELAQPGFYEVRDQASDAAAMVVAANVDLAESDLAAMDPAAVSAAVAAPGAAATGVAGAGPVPRDDVAEQSQRLWWYLLLAGMLLLIGESVVAGRFSGGTA
jgi:hypothetical protein